MTDRIVERVANLERRMTSVEATLERIALSQERTQTGLEVTGQRLDTVMQRLESFIVEIQPLSTALGEKANRNAAAIASSIEMAPLHDRQRQEDWAEKQSVFQRMDAMIGRLDILVNHLMRQESEL